MTITGLTQENLDWMRDALSSWESGYINKEHKKNKRKIINTVLQLAFVLACHIWVMFFTHDKIASYILSVLCGFYYGLAGCYLVKKIWSQKNISLKASELSEQAIQEYQALCRFFNASNKTIMGNTLYFLYNDDQCFVEAQLPGCKNITEDRFRKGINTPQVNFIFYKDDNGLPHYEYSVYKPYDDVKKHYF